MTVKLTPPSIEAIVLKGGLDQVTPTLSLPSGTARQMLNFECAVTGGYSRIEGYERFDGHASPADTAGTGAHRFIAVSAFTNTPAVGNTLTASGGATGVIAYITGLVMVLAKSSGTWAVGETVAVGATPIGTVSDIYAGPTTPLQDAVTRNAVADIYRADIAAVPGSGSIRGVVEFNDVVYAFRDNAGGTALDIYKSTASGWSQVSLYKTVSFTAGGTVIPADGATLTQGGVTSTIKRVVRTSGSWQAGTAAGQIIITTPAGGNFAAGAATIGSTNVTLSGAQASLALLPGGKFQFITTNFAGQVATQRVYGCDGVNKGFEFDGDVLVPITTGATTDTPTHVMEHKKFLFFSIGSSAMHSAPGLPYDWTAISGASEVPVGDTITDMIIMPGGTSTATLGIFSRNNTFILYGTGPSDWNLVTYNSGTGALPFSAQNMAQTFVFDDRGVNSVQTSLQFGNFTQSALTNQVLPFINERINLLTYATLCRRKSQYRLFFSDGFGLFVTVVNNKFIGCTPVYFPNAVTCCYEGKKNDGTDIIYFGSTNGMVYQMERGTSFDGTAIDWHLTLNFSSAKSPRTLKRYYKAVPELSASTGTYVAFDFAYVLGYDSPEYAQAVAVAYTQHTGQTRWDSFRWDSFFWDSGRAELMECPLEGTAENIAMFISGSSDYIPAFTINSILVHYLPRRMMR